MLIAISGSQGSGKSTIIKHLANMKFNIVGRKTSRSILEEWDVSLSEVNNNRDLTKRFQEEITKRKWADEKKATTSDVLWFTERTHADLFTYALVALGKDNEYSEFLDQYYKTSIHYNQRYAGVFYLKAGHFNIEHDGVRGSGLHYSRMVDLVMEDVTRQTIHPSKLSIIDTPNLEQRIQIIRLQSEMLLKQGK